MIKGIAFDLDGTLLDDTDVLIDAEIKAFAEKGAVTTRSELLSLGGTSVKDLAGSIMGRADDKLVKELRTTRKRVVLDELDRVEVFPETLPILQKLKQRGIKLSIATGLGRDLLPAFLEKTGISKFISIAVSADDVKYGKPAPDVFLRAFELMGVHTSEGLVVGDSSSDMRAAKSAGIKRALVVREGLPVAEADYTIDNLEEILNIL